MITETNQQYSTREYALCMERVDKYYVLQSWRRDQGYWGAAKFYQEQAKRWYKRAVIAHSKATVVIGIDLGKPGTDRTLTFFPMPNNYENYIVGEQG